MPCSKCGRCSKESLPSQCSSSECSSITSLIERHKTPSICLNQLCSEKQLCDLASKRKYRAHKLALRNRDKRRQKIEDKKRKEREEIENRLRLEREAIELAAALALAKKLDFERRRAQAQVFLLWGRTWVEAEVVKRQNTKLLPFILKPSRPKVKKVPVFCGLVPRRLYFTQAPNHWSYSFYRL